MMDKHRARPDATHGNEPLRLRSGHLLALAILAISLDSCGNCNGWTNPWYVGPHSCQSDHASESATTLVPSQ